MTETVIPLRALLGDLEPTACKLHCAVWNGEQHPLDVLADSWDEWVGWNSWRGAKNDFNRDFIFSLAVTHDNPAYWIFGGVFEVIARRNEPHTHAYEVKLREDYLGAYIKRLKVSYRLPGRNTRTLMEGAIDGMHVVEVLRDPYAGAPFPGHDQINISLSELEAVYLQRRQDWRHALEHMKGVYVVHDQMTGKPYVGSAYGDVGIWARWGQYVESLHGHNHELRALVDREGPAYARQNLTFALLEFWSMRTSDEEVLSRESHWKNVLLSREFGLNKN